MSVISFNDGYFNFELDAIFLIVTVGELHQFLVKMRDGILP